MSSTLPTIPPLAIRLLQVGVVCQCLGNAWWFAGNALPQIKGAETPLFALMWGDPEVGGFGWSESAVETIHAALALLWVGLGVAIAWRPLRAPLVVMTLLQLVIAVAMVWTGDGFRLVVPGALWSEPWLAAIFPLFAQAARIAAPLALLLLAFEQGRQTPSDGRLTLLALECCRWAIVAVFIAHGIEAIQHNPKFIDLILFSARRLSIDSLGQGVTEGLLTVIGIVDIVVAVVLAVSRSPWGAAKVAAGYMAAWGLITAASRVVALGVVLGGWGFATRMPHGILPAVLLVCWAHLPKTIDAREQNQADAKRTKIEPGLGASGQ